jgi:hypothetical protein
MKIYIRDEHGQRVLIKDSDQPVCEVIEDGKMCGKKIRRNGYCNKHGQRYNKYGDPTTYFQRKSPQTYPRNQMPEFCVNGDGKPSWSKGLCATCYRRELEWGKGSSGGGSRECECGQHRYHIRTEKGMCSWCWKKRKREILHEGNPHTPWRYWTQDRCLVAGLDWIEETGRIPTCDEWHRAKGYPDPATVRRRFGSWNIYIDILEVFVAEQTGGKHIPFKRNGWLINWTRESIIEATVFYIDLLGRIPTSDDFDGPSRRASGLHLPSQKVVYTRFGSWPTFKKALTEHTGVHYERRTPQDYWWADEILATGAEYLALTGKMPSARAWSPPLRYQSAIRLPGVATVQKRFGKWSIFIARLESFIAERQAA